MTGWAVLGLEAAGVNPLDLDRGDATPISYLAGTAGEITTTGDIERTILVLRGAGLDPRRFHGTTSSRRLLARRGRDGSWGGQVNPTAFGIFALRAAGMSAGNARSAAWLRSVQNDDGGGASRPARRAIRTRPARCSRRSPPREAAPGCVPESATCGGAACRWRLRPRGRLGERAVDRLGGPGSDRRWGLAVLRPCGGRSPLDYLASVKAADGHYRYSTATDQTPVWVTAQALMAVNGKAFPLAPVSRRTQPQAGGGRRARRPPSPSHPGASTPGKPIAKPAAPPAAPAEPASADPVPLAPASAGEEGEDRGISPCAPRAADRGRARRGGLGRLARLPRRLPDSQ